MLVTYSFFVFSYERKQLKKGFKSFPIKKHRITLNKSSHVHKKSKERFVFFWPNKMAVTTKLHQKNGVLGKQELAANFKQIVCLLGKKYPDASFFWRKTVTTNDLCR